MHSIINSQEKCIGQYLIIEDDTYTTRLFARFYNMCITSKDEAPITEEDVINAIKMKKYNLQNNIHIYDLKTDNICLKQLKIGLAMVYLNEKNRLYLATEEELEYFLCDNNYKTIESTTYVLGIPDIYKFKNVRPISSNNINNAINVYKKRYNIKEDPVLIGIKMHESLYINLNDHILVAEVDENDITKTEEGIGL